MSKRLYLVGQKFGYLVVIKDVGNNEKGRSQWLCRCKCGNEVIVRGINLRYGHTKSCGCYNKERTSETHRLDLVGKRFERLVVIKDGGNDKRKSACWLCKCDCGNEIIVVGSSLISGHTKSCGCLSREIVIKMGKRRVGKNSVNYKHGLSRTKAYRTQYVAKYKTKKKNQTPLNADLEEITYIYQVCETMNQTNEEKYEVDHIKPISKGGLHHQNNLQILWWKLNREKSDKYSLTEAEQVRYKGITLKDLKQNGLGKY